jgi:hypothetical protein
MKSTSSEQLDLCHICSQVVSSMSDIALCYLFDHQMALWSSGISPSKVRPEQIKISNWQGMHMLSNSALLMPLYIFDIVCIFNVIIILFFLQCHRSQFIVCHVIDVGYRKIYPVTLTMNWSWFPDESRAPQQLLVRWLNTLEASVVDYGSQLLKHACTNVSMLHCIDTRILWPSGQNPFILVFCISQI